MTILLGLVLAGLFGVLLALLELRNGLRKAEKRPDMASQPEIIGPDLRVLQEAIRLIGQKVSDLERGQATRDAELTDAIDRFGSMAKRLSVRADRAQRRDEGEPVSEPHVTGALEAVMRRRNGVR